MLLPSCYAIDIDTVSQVVGFGLMDAEAMVTRAKAWTLVNPQVTCLTATKEVDMYVLLSTLCFIFFLRNHNLVI